MAGIGDARALPRQLIETFAEEAPVVMPSGASLAMIRLHYPDLFKDQPVRHTRARALAQRTYELTQFMHQHFKLPRRESTRALIAPLCLFWGCILWVPSITIIFPQTVLWLPKQVYGQMLSSHGWSG